MDKRKVRSLQKRLHSHAASHCANHIGKDGCLLTPHGKCVLSFMADRPIGNVCPIYMRSVGPANPKLFNEYLEYFPDDYPLKPKKIEGGKDCAICGQRFKPASNRAKYCDGCKAKVKAEQARLRMKKKRLEDAIKQS